MNRFELKEFRKKLKLTQTEFAKLFEKATMRTIQNWEGGATPVPEYVELVIEKYLNNIKAPSFVSKDENLHIALEDVSLKNKNKIAPSQNENDNDPGIISRLVKMLDDANQEIKSLRQELDRKKNN